jgi:glycosyltransferase involved in cell wall biosynthesis
MGRVLIIHPALAPYRADFFNDVAQKIPGLHLFFLLEHMVGQPISLGDFEVNYDYTIGIRGKQNVYRPLIVAVRALPALIKTVFKQRPETIVTNEFGLISILMALYCRLSGTRHIAWTDDSLDNILQCGRGRKLRRDFVLRLSDRLIVCNISVRDYFRARLSCPVESVEILQKEPVFRQGLQRSVPVANEYIERYQLHGKKIVLFVGRLVEVKNIPALIAAFTLLRDEKAILVLAGSGVLENSLRELVAKHNLTDRVIFTGHLRGEALYAWFLLGGLFVLPSTFEPFGAVVNEALLTGMPVLCSKYAGATCLIEENDNGAVFDPIDSVSFESRLSAWMEKAQPVGVVGIMRSSLMKIRYEDAVAGFVAVCHG